MNYEEHLDNIENRIAALREQCALLYPKPREVTFEIGSGHGHYLISYAQAEAQDICLGIDILNRRIEKARAKAEKRNLENIVFLKAEALELLEVLPKRVTFSKVFVLFPDPWPKKRHFKNRLVQAGFLSKLAERMSAGQCLYFRTDHEAYFDWATEALEAHPDWQLQESFQWPHEANSYFQDLMDDWSSLVAFRTS